MVEVGIHLAGSDLQLEDAMAADIEHALGLFDVLGGIATGQGPGHFQTVAYPTAEQLADR